jgi:glutamate-5-semialdehyde dehydrogenase
MFADPRLALAVARGSGPAVAQLARSPRQAGDAGQPARHWRGLDGGRRRRRRRAVLRGPSSIPLDRKVCNTLNVCCIVRARADELVPGVPRRARPGGARRKGWKLHVAEADFTRIPESIRALRGTVVRAEGPVEEPLVEPIADADLGREWEWEETPEVTLKIVESVDEAVALFNRHSPRFAASLISEDLAAQDRFYQLVDAPFTGDGFTPLGRRAVCVGQARARTLQLAEWAALRARRSAGRRRRLLGPRPRPAGRPRPRPWGATPTPPRKV